MGRHRQSEEMTKTAPQRGPSFISLGARTKGWDKNPPARDCPYGIFGKKMQRSILGFGSLATAIYSRDLITEAALHESHGTVLSKSQSRYFRQRLQYHQENETTEYSTMRRAVEALFAQFPDIQRDVAQAKQNSDPLIKKIRLVMAGAHAARNADVNLIRRQIFVLCEDDAQNRGWGVPTKLEKSERGLKLYATGLFLLPPEEREEYLADIKGYRKKVECNEIKLSLSNTWPAILYNEDMIDVDNEFSGLFRSETLLRCGITILHGPSAGEYWKYPQPGARSFASSQKESNAEINGITKITPEAIAYFSTLAVFAVHHGECYVRDLGGIDLSELYHDVVAALRTRTKWASETLEFWNKIFFGDREEEECEPKTSRADRFKKLEAAQRKREGLPKPNTRPPEASQPPRHRPAQDPDVSPPSDLEDEDEPAPPKNNPRSGTNARKRKFILDIDSDLDEDEGGEGDKGKDDEDDNTNKDNGRDQDDRDEGEGSNKDEITTLRRPLKKKQKLPNGQGSLLTTPQSKAGKKKQVTRDTSQSLESEEQVDYVRVDEWDRVCEGFRKAIEHAKAAGLKEAHSQFTNIISMSAEKGTRYVNAGYERLEWLKNDVEKKYKAIRAAESTPPEDEEPTPEPPTPKKDPTPKRPVAKKAGAAAQKNTKAKPPPRVTRSITAAAEHFRREAQAQAQDEFNPLTNFKEPATPTNVRSVREKLPVGATPSLRRR